MELQSIERFELDDARWNKTMAESFDPQIQLSTHFLDVLCPDWTPMIVGNYNWLMPIPTKAIWGIHYCVQPPFIHQGGLIGKIPASNALSQAVFKHLKKRYTYINLYLNAHHRHSFNGRKTYYLNLNKPYEQIRKNYSRNTRYLLNKSMTSGLTIRKISTQKVVDEFIEHIAYRSSALLQLDFKLVESLVKSTNSQEKYLSLGVFKNEALIASAMFVLSGQKALYFLASVNRAYKIKSASRFLLDRFIRDYSGKKLVLDFEGSMEEGVASFYQSFGSMAVEISEMKHFQSSFVAKVVGAKRFMKTLL